MQGMERHEYSMAAALVMRCGKTCRERQLPDDSSQLVIEDAFGYEHALSTYMEVADTLFVMVGPDRYLKNL